MSVRLKVPGALVALSLAAVAAAGCGSSSDNSSTSSNSSASTGASTPAAAPAADALGTAKKASGKPIVLGLLNLESGPVTFPEYRQAAELAVKYINDYKGGIGGRPVQLASCATDGQPATSGRCANQIADKNPTAILGGADTGAPGAFPVWERKRLAYMGGIPFTPVESNAPNAVQFYSVSVGDNLATVQYAVKELGVKKASVIYTDDSQGKATGLGVIVPAFKAAGAEAKAIPVSPSAADLSSAAAAAIGSSPDAVYVNTPNACPAVLKALKAVGYTGKIMGIDPCTSPPALKAAGDSAEGLYFAQPFVSLDSGDKDANLMGAAIKKYGGSDIALDSIAQAGFSSVMNVQAALDGVSDLTEKNILAAFKDGRAHDNFMAHPYTCDGKQLAGNTAVCNTFQKIKQIKSGKVTTVTDDWVNGASLYKPQS
ncbi:ABC transporter substrate-binding protein [Conexibacter woesei]|uniref:ABC transporter substrate-binding protein n=1 Tax=Conexibacter woesei TaxID=191495 RepID=UPI0018CB34B6|nr:ABC transporter substrate-binding protein [Conexibacter woesei]